MKQENKLKGSKGENIARVYLQNKGYKIIDQNFENKFGELDLIMSKENTLIFIEVKLKTGDDFGSPEEMINSHKLRQIQNTGVSYLQKFPEIDNLYAQKQIDAVCIVLGPKGKVIRINHYENITF
ncbi:YraN family protein [Candidatus Woesebacteria bacterium]|nr:YraN family protein [Candidatus Woesebacteria bacterium]QQG47707.1 MAG: YraN family protein [Candidatus Woesebacteria bacterium]